MEEKKESVLSGQYIILSVFFGVVLAGLYLYAQEDPLTISIDRFRQVVVVGGCVGLIAKYISSSRYAVMKKIAGVVMGCACSTIGMTWVMLFYIARG